jgi:hypothetical protein
VTTYEVRWLNGTVERVTCRFVDLDSGIMRFRQAHTDGPMLVLAVNAVELHSVRPVVDDEARPLDGAS